MGDCPIVETLSGKVSGRCCVKAKPRGSKQVYRYASIPFAKPPVGELRFKPPQKADCWDGVRDCVKRGKSPMQDTELFMEQGVADFMVIAMEFDENPLEVDEDCLHVDVYTSNPNPSAKMPVLFWIYGGGFQLGNSTFYDGNVLAGTNDVVVVVPQYRVNAFGFLSFGKDSACPGNMGLLDQVCALQWTRDNIGAFGGNPENVTIFGESAGGVSVGLHLVSPLSRNLFHRAISHSGVSEFPLLVKSDNDSATRKMLACLNITEKDPDLILSELRKLPASDIVKAQRANLKEFDYFSAVCDDGGFLPESPSAVSKKRTFARVPYIVGVNSTEGCGLLGSTFDRTFPDGLSEQTARLILDGFVGTIFPKNVDKVRNLVIEEYGRDLARDDESRWSKIVGTVHGDLWFILPSVKAATAHSGSGAATFFYHMTQQLRFHHDRQFGGDQRKLRVDFCECDHCDDITFTFGIPLSNAKLSSPVKFSDDEAAMSQFWMSYLVNFAATGNPNDGKEVPVAWKQYQPADGSYLEVCSSPANRTHLHADRVRFWTETLPDLANL